ncbi:uridine diphosphate glucose pyrophosphatase NUDT14-like isoform X1 [Babylonia areolata]|uniref:uridine diphosphate glucose pyrophosphatase NUDT14-like isoform X1 n=1 Tax=Babylonia areolata TaxID=304850 RepID=UPI003FD4E443
MEKIANVTVRPCQQSKFIKPLTIDYTQNGIQKAWDAIDVHNSVAILTFNKTREQFVFVKQFRPAVYLKDVTTHKDEDGVERVDTDKFPGSMGLCLELCAGILDKSHSAQETAQLELMEECGYKVPLDSIQKITTFRGGVGSSGSLQTLFYAEVTDAMQVGKGGGLAEEGEMIEVVHMSVEEGQKLIFDETVNRPSGLLFGLMWFFSTKWQK